MCREGSISYRPPSSATSFGLFINAHNTTAVNSVGERNVVCRGMDQGDEPGPLIVMPSGLLQHGLILMFRSP